MTAPVVKTLTPSKKKGMSGGAVHFVWTLPAAAASFSDVYDLLGFKDKTFYLQNSTDKQQTFQVQASPVPDFTRAVVPVGSPIVLADGSVTVTVDKGVLPDYHRYVRVQRTGAADATVGQADLDLLAQGYEV